MSTTPMNIIVLAIFFLVPNCVCMFSYLKNWSWTIPSSASQTRHFLGFDHTGVIVNGNDNFWKRDYGWTNPMFSVNQSTFVTAAVHYETDTIYSVYCVPQDFFYIAIKRHNPITGSTLWNNTWNLQSQIMPTTRCCTSTTQYAQTSDKNSGSLIFAQNCGSGTTYAFRVFSNGTWDVGTTFPDRFHPNALTTEPDGTPWIVGISQDLDSKCSFWYGNTTVPVPMNSPFLAKLFKSNLTIQFMSGLTNTAIGADWTFAILYMSDYIYIGGMIDVATNFSAAPAVAADFDAYIARYNLSGGLEAVLTLGSTQQDTIMSIMPESRPGKLFVCGTTRGDFYGPGYVGEPTFFIARINATGNMSLDALIWTDRAYNLTNSTTGDTVSGCAFDVYQGIMYTSMTRSSVEKLARAYTYADFTPSPSPSRTPSPSPSTTPSRTASPSVSPSPTPSRSPSSTPSSSVTPSISPTPTSSPSAGSITPNPSSSATHSPSTISSQDDKNSSQVAAIAGGVAGGTFLAAMVGTALFIVFRKKRRGEQQQDELQQSPRDPEMRNSIGLTMEMQQRFEIPYDEIMIEKEIGRGAFGVVYKANWRKSECVVKQLNINDDNSKQEFMKEAVNVMKLKSHQNVCTVFGICTDPRHPTSIVMEYVDGGSLHDFVYNDKANLDGLTTVRLAKDIAGGMCHIHKEGLLHCDLACRNLLYTSRGNGRYVVKVADLGMARISEGGHYDAKEAAKFPIRWSAPEVLSKRKLSRASDVWAFGVVIFEMLEGKLPYFSMKNAEVAEFVCNGGTPTQPTRVDCPDLWKLALMCMQMDPSNRPSFDKMWSLLSELETQLSEPNSPKKLSNETVYGNASSQSGEVLYQEPN